MSSELPTIMFPIMVGDRVVGRVTVEPDGIFIGELSDNLVHAELVDLMRHGFARGISVSPYNVPAERGDQNNAEVVETSSQT